MRSRYIKPGICSNEDLVELGPYAYILFTGLWMYADREGRFEFRPKKIKAEVMPMWDECPVEKVVENLWKMQQKGLLSIYEIDGKQYCAIPTWHKHQRPHPREAASLIPPPPPVSSDCARVSSADATVIDGTTKAVPKHNLGAAEPGGEWGMGNGEPPSAVCARGGVGSGKLHSPMKKPVGSNGTAPPAAARKVARKLDPPKKPPRAPERPKARSAPVDWWPHRQDDVAVVRERLEGAGGLAHLPPPDDQIVRRVLDVCRGAPVAEILSVIDELVKRRRFAAMYSWGFAPLVIGQRFSYS